MQLDTERLTIREIESRDLHDVHALHSFPEVDQYNTLGIPTDVQDTEAFLAPIIDDSRKPTRTVYGWAIEEKSSGEFIGMIGMTVAAERFRMAEIYFKLNPASWGKGYATEAAQAVIRLGFEQLGLHRIEAGVATENAASIRVLEKLGMTREGTRRQVPPIRGGWKDNYHYAILESAGTE